MKIGEDGIKFRENPEQSLEGTFLCPTALVLLSSQAMQRDYPESFLWVPWVLPKQYLKNFS